MIGIVGIVFILFIASLIYIIVMYARAKISRRPELARSRSLYVAYLVCGVSFLFLIFLFCLFAGIGS